MEKKRNLKDRIKLGLCIFGTKCFFLIEKHLLKIKSINYPEIPVIFSMLHAHQCLVYGIKNKDKFYALISASNDGEIIARAAECLNIKSIRGSSKRHGTAAALNMIEKLKDGNSIAIMVDGPKGPYGKVKDGIVNISKNSGVPIVPVAWHSKCITFMSWKSWDKFKVPLGPCKTVALYGDPIYIPSELNKEQTKEWCERIEEEMKRLQTDLEENFEKYLSL